MGARTRGERAGRAGASWKEEGDKKEERFADKEDTLRVGVIAVMKAGEDMVGTERPLASVRRNEA